MERDGNSITLVDNRRIIEPGEIIVEPQTTQPRSRLDSADFVQGIYTKERVSAMHRAANEMGGIAVSVVAQPGQEYTSSYGVQVTIRPGEEAVGISYNNNGGKRDLSDFWNRVTVIQQTETGATE
jgi:hypothetical protein